MTTTHKQVYTGWSTMTVLDSTQTQVRAEDIVKRRLEQGAASIEEITGLLSDSGIPFSRRRAKGIAWRMVEEGKARFNNNWLLELQN